MTDRPSAYLVTLSGDIREDDAGDGILTALRMIKGVISVEPVTANPLDDQVARARRDRDWISELSDLITRVRGKA